MNNCKVCNLDCRNKFCSSSCAATYNNKLYPKRQPSNQCKVCSSQITTRQVYCKSCKSKKVRKPIDRVARVKAVVTWRYKAKTKAVEYKGGKCLGCGYDKCQQALTFHHLDPAKKDFGISGHSISWDKMKVELDKCVLLCHNCHSEVHAGVRSLAD